MRSKSRPGSFPLPFFWGLLLAGLLACQASGPGGQAQASGAGADPTASGPDPVLTVGEEYLRSLYARDYETLGRLMAMEARFSDPSSRALGGEAWHKEGRAEILEFFRASMAGVISTGFDLERSFSTGEYAVFWVTYRSEVRGDTLGAPGHRIQLGVPGVSIVRVVDGRVVEHIDHVDYDELLRQVEEQRQAAR